MTNQEIITLLKTAATNAYAVKDLLPKWDKSESFPKDDLETCIKMQQWEYKDFDYEMEMIVKEYLPDFMLDVFFDMKEFRSNSRNELTSSCITMSKMYGYPMETQDDKAYCQYKYSFMKYYENSRLNKGEQNA